MKQKWTLKVVALCVLQCLFQLHSLAFEMSSAQLIQLGISENNSSQVNLPLAKYQRDLYFDNVTLADGLNQSSIYAIAKDLYGFTWLGTQDGLHRFDGYKAELVKLSQTDIPHYRFIKALKIINNILFIGTTEGLIAIELASGFKHYFSALGFKINTIEKVKQQIWLGTEKGIYILNQHDLGIEKKLNVITDICQQTLRVNKQLCSNDSRALLFQANKNKMWVGTVNGLYTLNLNTNKVSYIKVDFEQPAMLSSNDIRALFLDNLNQVWIGTFDGLNQYIEKTKSFHRYIKAPNISIHSFDATETLTSNKIKSISQDIKGYLWVTTTNGLNRSDEPVDANSESIKKWYQFNHQSQTNNGLLSDLIRTSYADKQGRIWLGTNKGLSVTNIYRTQTQVIRSFNGDSRLSYIMSYKQDSYDNHWLGSRNGLTVVTKHGKQVRISGIENQPVYSIAFSENFVWAGTKKGLYKVDLKQFKIHTLYNASNSPIDGRYIYTLLSSDNNILWLGTSYGLLKFNYVSNKWYYWNKAEGLAGHEIYSLKIIDFSTAKKALWIGTNAGLSILTNDNAIVNFHNKNSNLNSNWIFDINQDSFNKIWLATSGGIYSYQPKTQAFEYHTIIKGNSYAILFDSLNNLWVSTNQGIYQYNQQTALTKQYLPIHGFSDLEYIDNSNFKNNMGKFSFGGLSGITFFSPDKIESFQQKLPYKISSLEVNNKSISLWQKYHQTESSALFLQNTLSINWNTNNFKVLFNNPYFALPKDKNNIATNLIEGQLELSYLSSGQHKIDIPVNSDSGKLLIYKAAHPLLSAWAFIIYALLLLCLCYFIWRHYFLDKYAKSLNIKNLLIEQQQIELKQNLQAKQQLYFQIQHSMKSPISAQKGFIYQINKLLKQDNLDKISLNRKFNKLAQLQEHLALMVEEILHLSKTDSIEALKKINVLTVIKQIKEALDALTYEKSLTIKYDIDQSITQDIFLIATEHSLFNILENILTNAIKFSFENSQIDCSLSLSNKQLQIIISDLGIGIPKNEIKNIKNTYYRATNSSETKGSGVGLAIVFNTIKTMKGDIKISSEVNKGTQVSITLPLAQ
ncbi:ligand-binding sensor domain-containing protein [Litorilituus lipolyticus]|uniref:histidine kinase n=1 Tax=Litorilituus lipolyticus TaxID=2491017 RepID=A0A502L3F2_9GAMM|nr:two-component regulator propeller domain-containing protein [Litorilituus lipolyticus]TPH18382.1 hypothetical protein EPA86_02520 [Litorilituus lipolyticus]